MEPTSQQQPQPMAPQPVQPQGVAQPGVSFPEAKQKGKSKVKWIIFVVVIVIVVGLVGWFLMKDGGENESTPSPSPEVGGLSAFATSTPDPTPKPTEAAKEKVDQSEVKIEILNGTGTAGDAGLVKSALAKLGYEDIEAANAQSQDETRTTVTYSRDLDSETMDEITGALEKIFTEVRVRKGSLSGGVMVRVVTGPRKGAASPTPTAEASPTASPEAVE